MATVLDLNLRDFVSKAVVNVFSTMLSMQIELLPSDKDVTLPGQRVVGAVGFAGKAMGVVYIHVTDDFAKAIAGKLLGMKPEELNGSAEVNDVIGEVSNMVGGNLKSSLCDSGLTCALTIPSITRGGDFQVESLDGGRQERFAFKYQDQNVLVHLDIKAGEAS